MSAGAAWVHGIAPDAINREVDDFYPTPPEATRPILDVVPLPAVVGEPACGEGDIAKELIARGHRVIATDLIDRGFGVGGVDFLKGDWPAVRAIVTNPPFKLWDEFARRAQEVALDQILLLGRTALASGAARQSIFNDPAFPLAAVFYFTRRVRLWRGRLWRDGDGSPMFDLAWFYFRRGHVGAPPHYWIDPKP